MKENSKNTSPLNLRRILDDLLQDQRRYGAVQPPAVPGRMGAWRHHGCAGRFIEKR